MSADVISKVMTVQEAQRWLSGLRARLVGTSGGKKIFAAGQGKVVVEGLGDGRVKVHSIGACGC